MTTKIPGIAAIAVALFGCNANAADLAGRTPTAFAVSPSGAATYSIPIFAPPGTRGMTPQLALVYNHRSVSGPAGAGWDIAGLSAISRCPRTVAADGGNRNVRNDSQDRFCLDGNKLRLTSNPSSKPYGSDGATYQTEIEAFSRITSFGTAGQPISFKVERKDGLIYEYGSIGSPAMTDAVILSVGQSWARVWALKRISDRSDNAIVFTYAQDSVNGAYRIEAIDYASSTNASATVPAPYQIDFVWEPVPAAEVESAYLAGSRIKRVRRLDRIDHLHAGAIVRRYDLAYQSTLSSTTRSRLASVTECAGAATADCLPATTFAYQNGTGGVTTAMNPEINTNFDVPTTPWPMDVNGDGRDDLVYSSSTTSGAGVWMVMFANSAGGYNTPTPTHTNANYQSATPIDYNADGFDDLLVHNSSNTWSVMLGTSTGFAAPLPTGAPVTATGRGTNARALDVNGDGYEDLVWADLVGFGGGDAIRYRLREPAGAGTFSATVSILVGPMGSNVMMVADVFGPAGQPRRLRKPDFNGDGQDDLAYQKIRRVWIDGPNFWQVHYSIHTRCLGGNDADIPTGTPLLAPASPYFGDFNADGRTDLLYDNDNGFWNVRFSTGSSFTAPAFGPSYGGYGTRYALVDWDSDGYEDILAAKSTTQLWDLARATGEGFSGTASTGYGASGASNVTVMDMNGDGLDDFGYVVGGKWRYRTHAGSYPDLLQQATDGYGNSVTFNYAPLTTPVYTKNADGVSAAFPEQDYQGSLYVVSSFAAADGIGGTYTSTFSYMGARVHLQGRGFEGFYRVQSQDDRNDLRARSYFNQLFPLTGTLSKAEMYQADGTTLIERTQNTWAAQSYDNPNATNEARKLPFVSQSIATRHALGGSTDGALISTATTNNSLHVASGTIYDSTTTTKEEASANGVQVGAQYSRRVYMPPANLVADTANWCMGKPGQVQVIGSHNQYGGAAITRTTSIDWDNMECRPTQIRSEPGDSQLELTRTLAYDDFGNLSSENIGGIGVDSRTRQFNFGSTGQFLRDTTDPLSKKTIFLWDESLGVATQVKDPNQVAVNFQYDVLGRRTGATRPDGSATTWSYGRCTSGCGTSKMIVSETLLAGSTPINGAQLLLDSFDRPVTSKSQLLSGGYSRIDRQYDDLGRVHRQSAPCWDAACSQLWAATFAYDKLGRITKVSRPLSDSDLTPQDTDVSYDGLTTQVTDPLDKHSTQVAAVIGGVARSINHDGHYQTFDADGFGNIVRVTDSLGNTLLSNVFNKLGMRREQTDMAAGRWLYTPNALGEVTSQTDAKGHQTSFDYDVLGRLTSRVEHDPTGNVQNTWTWGNDQTKRNIGRLESMSGPGYSEGYEYDVHGRPIKRTINAGTNYVFAYTYNGFGALATLTYPTTTGAPAFALSYEYLNGILKYVKDANAPTTVFWTANDTDASGNVISETRGPSLQTLSSFDAVTDLPDFIQSGAGGAVQDLEYTWNAVGRLTDREDDRVGLAEHFTYDNIHRLTGVTGPDPGSVSYDARGNILSRSGNVSAGNSATTEWYSDGLPKKVTGPTGFSSEFFYGPEGQRWKQTAGYGAGTNEETISIGGLLEKVTRNGVVTWRHYIHGGSGAVAVQLRGSANSLYYLTTDHLGSIDSVTTGATTTNLSYGAFGQRRNAGTLNGNPTSGQWTAVTNATRHGFTQHEMLDNLNLIHMNGRVYDQLAGQFISADPFIDGPGSTQGWNRYAYVHNSPLSSIDPSGFTDIPKALPKDGHRDLWDFMREGGNVGEVAPGIWQGWLAAAAMSGPQPFAPRQTPGMSLTFGSGTSYAVGTNPNASAGGGTAGWLHTYEQNLNGLSFSQRQAVFWEAGVLRDYLGYLSIAQVRGQFPYLLTSRADDYVLMAQLQMTESLGALQVRLIPETTSSALLDLAIESSKPFKFARDFVKLREAIGKSPKELRDSWIKKLGSPKNVQRLYDTYESDMEFECGNVITQTFSCYVVFPLPVKLK
jgi:RHS repeat-associated protein